VLFESFFLQDGHIGSPSSFDLPLPSPDAEVVNTTGVRPFKLSSCAGFPPRQVVVTLMFSKEVGGPLEVYVGVKEGSQKSGSLCLRASACSRSS